MSTIIENSGDTQVPTVGNVLSRSAILLLGLSPIAWFVAGFIYGPENYKFTSALGGAAIGVFADFLYLRRQSKKLPEGQ